MYLLTTQRATPWTRHALTSLLLGVLMGCSSGGGGSNEGGSPVLSDPAMMSGGSTSPPTPDFAINGFYRTGSTVEDFNSLQRETTTTDAPIAGAQRLVENHVRTDGGGSSSTHELDARGRLVSLTLRDQDGAVQRVERFEYNSIGLPSRELFEFADGSTRRQLFAWTVNDQLESILRDNFDAEGNMESRFTFVFEFRDGQLQSMQSRRIGDLSDNFTEFRYTLDENNRITERVATLMPVDQVSTRTVWTFDENGNVETRNDFAGDGTLRVSSSFSYQPTPFAVYNASHFQRQVMP